ncbi:GH19940 [Drosophila grimshawi]|uniref:GH19940 n=1 Tax=Drosophila grimshawi TaxID=7222 RepID=B4J8R6_DROGR|nr:GH19940 [Drosophila grimshawi]
MCNKLLLLQLLVICLILAIPAQVQQTRLRLPPGYNMRLGPVPARFVGKGAYTLVGKRASPPAKWQQQPQQVQQLQQLQQQKQLQQQQQRRQQLFQWATMGGKMHN